MQPASPLDFQRQRMRMVVFAELIGDVDRNKGNVLYTSDWRVIMIDFTRPQAPRMIARYSLIAVGGQPLPATVPALPGSDCQIRIVSAQLDLQEHDTWRLSFQEEEICYGESHPRPATVREGVSYFEHDHIVLESDELQERAVILGDELELTLHGIVYLFRVEELPYPS